MNNHYNIMATQNSQMTDRKRIRTSPELMITNSDSAQICTWPRFLLVKGIDNERPLSKVSLFAVNKPIVGVLGSDPCCCTWVNVPFTIRELCDALKNSHDTATGQDEIHYQLLKHLPRDSLMVFLTYLTIYGLQVKSLNAGKRPLWYLFLNQAKTLKTCPIIIPYL